MTSIIGESKKLNPAQRVDYSTKMGAFLKTVPGLIDSGINADLSLWGTFKDGRFLFIANNKPAYPTAMARSLPPPPAAPSGTSQPTSNVVYYFDYFSNSSPLTTLQSIVNTHNYVLRNKDATLDNFRGLTNISAMYLSTHGGEAKSGAGPDRVFNFVMLTTTPVNAANEVAGTLHDDLVSGRVGYSLDPVDAARPNPKWKYGITPAFVTANWSFNSVSMLYAAVCESGDATDFQNACKGKKLDTYIGWSGDVRGDVGEFAGEILLDRMMGANKFEAADKPRRAYTIADALSEVTRENADHYQDGPPPQGSGMLATLKPISFGNQFGVLAPSIKFIVMDEKNSLMRILGQFGADPGESNRDVKINGNSYGAKITSWSTNMILVKVPASQTDPDFAGKINVVVRNQESNTVDMTKITGKLTYTQKSLGSLQTAITIDFYIRADLQKIRTHVNDDPTRPDQNIVSIQTSKCTITNSGVFNDPTTGETVTWNGTYTPVNKYFNVANNTSYYTCTGFLDSAARTISFDVNVDSNASRHIIQTVNGNHSSFDEFVSMAKEIYPGTVGLVPVKFDGQTLGITKFTKDALSGTVTGADPKSPIHMECDLTLDPIPDDSKGEDQAATHKSP
jgi:hypothetical protein